MRGSSINSIFRYFKSKRFRRYEEEVKRLREEFKKEVDEYPMNSKLRKEILNWINSSPKKTTTYKWESLTLLYFEPYEHTNPFI